MTTCLETPVRTLTMRVLVDRDVARVAEWVMHDAARWQVLGFAMRPASAEVYAWIARFRDEHFLYVITADTGIVGAVLVESPTPQMGVAHILIAPHAKGQGVAIARAGLAAAPRFGWTRLVAAQAPHLPPAVHARWLRRVGFELRHYGDWRAKESHGD